MSKRTVISAVLLAAILTGGVVSANAKTKASTKAVAAPVAVTEVSNNDIDINVGWDNGIQLSAANKQYTMNIGGLIFSDWSLNVSADEDIQALNMPGNSSNMFPKTRLDISGTIHEKAIYKMQFRYYRNAGQDDYAFEDYYLGVKDIPYAGRLRVGRFKESISMENLIGSPNKTFISSSYVGTMTPDRNVGLAFNNALFDSRVTWALGLFQENAADRDWTAAKTNFTGRATFAPYFDDATGDVIHVGFGYSSRFPEAAAANYVVTSEHVRLMNIEAALAMGPVAVQLEYMSEQDFIVAFDDDPTFNSFMIQASYFIFGSNRAYKASEGIFGAVDLSQKDEWEIVARFSSLDTDTDDFPGTQASTITLGTNWYIGNNARLMVNYNMVNIVDAGNLSNVQTRVQLNF